MQYVVSLPKIGEQSLNVTHVLAEIHQEFADVKLLPLGSIGEELDERTWIASVCLGISRHSYEGDSLHFISSDNNVNRLPDISFATRTLHRSIGSYTFIDCIPEKLLPDWPDAPVTLIVTNPLSALGQSAKLRGWDVVTIDIADLDHTVAKTLQKFFL
ncbi:MAG: hypothetical protein ACO3XJ_03260 [Candidatus Nanopelagicales bacterium]